jgi:hypothetical protein
MTIQRNIGIDNEKRSDDIAREPKEDLIIFLFLRIWSENPPNPQPKRATEIAINA